MAMSPILSEPRSAHDVWGNLTEVCAGQGLDALAGRLHELRPWLEGDLALVERALGGVGDGDTLAHKSARHLLDGAGKRLRPLCVALASRVGSGFGVSAQRLAVAVELVHAATLLHDDVVDLGDRRRGVLAARVVYGNAASIYGGDWLLCEALCRIQSAEVPDALDRMLTVIKEMVIAESLQLADRRGAGAPDVGRYMCIAQGKTAALFGWAAFAGARAGGLELEGACALESFGHKLGLAFQIVDDVLDVAGDPALTGKSLLADVREGKMTYPLILAAERDPRIAVAIQEVAQAESGPAPALLAGIARALLESGAVEASFEAAMKLSREAVGCLSVLPAGPARSALEAVALATVRRRR